MTDDRRYCTVEIRMIVNPVKGDYIEKVISDALFKDVAIVPGEVDIYAKVGDVIQINPETNFAIPLPEIERK